MLWMLRRARHCFGMMPVAIRMRSIDENGLYDHIIYNDDVDAAYDQLAQVAARALQGGVGTSSLDGAEKGANLADNSAASAVVQVQLMPTSDVMLVVNTISE